MASRACDPHCAHILLICHVEIDPVTFQRLRVGQEHVQNLGEAPVTGDPNASLPAVVPVHGICTPLQQSLDHVGASVLRCDVQGTASVPSVNSSCKNVDEVGLGVEDIFDQLDIALAASPEEDLRSVGLDVHVTESV